MDALAAGFLTLSNEDVRTVDSQQHGGFDALPEDLRDLYGTLVQGPDANVADRSYEDTLDLAITGVHDQVTIADLLGRDGVNGYVPGTEFAVAAERQAASWLSLDDDMYEFMITGAGQDEESMNHAMQSILDVGSRNHDASEILLTGWDPDGNLTPPGYTKEHFANAIFTHGWEDDGAAAAKLFSWTAESAHDPGAHGDSARHVLQDLPKLFAPYESGGTYSEQKLSEQAATFKEFASSFHDNPALADAMSSVVTSNLDAFIDPGLVDTLIGPDGTVVFNREDGDRLLFLGSQSETGSQGLITANDVYRHGVLAHALADPVNPDMVLLRASGIDGLDARITSTTLNAQTFLLSEDVAAQNEAARKAFEFRETVINGIAEGVRIPIDLGVEAGTSRLGPGGPLASSLIDAGLSVGQDWIVERAVGDEPTELRVEMPNTSALGELVDRRVRQEILAARSEAGFEDPLQVQHGRDVDLRDGTLIRPADIAEFQELLPSGLRSYLDQYFESYKRQVSTDTAGTDSDLDRLINGTN